MFRLNENAKASTGPSPRNAFFDPRTHRNSFFIINLFCVSQQCRRRGSPPLSVPEAADAPDLRRGRRPLRRSLAAAAAGGPSTVVRRRRTELSLATYFDIAVVRCLFISHWSEEGVYWALTYLSRRLKGILVILLQIR